jgi:ComF family protein
MKLRKLYKTRIGQAVQKAAPFAEAFRETLFPSCCPICGTFLIGAGEAGRGICSDCAKLFPAGPSASDPSDADSSAERCSVCGKPLISEIGVCTTCRKRENWPLSGCAAVYPYTGKYEKLLIAYKFGPHRHLSRFFAEKFVEARAMLPGDVPEDAVWVPVPPRDGKLKRTGWDQIERVARELETGAFQVPLKRVLRRLASETQKKLSREERAKNLSGKILCREQPPRNVILFDDVFTTGSTLEACARALKCAGTEKVWGICLFYA